MSETVYRTGEWIIAVDRWGDVLQRTLIVKIAKEDRSGVTFYGPGGRLVRSNNDDQYPPSGSDVEFRLPVGCEAALAAALTDRQEPSERLTNKLEALLEREAKRVDAILDRKLLS